MWNVVRFEKIFFPSFFLDQVEPKSEKKTKVKILKSSDISSSRFCATRPKGWRPREKNSFTKNKRKKKNTESYFCNASDWEIVLPSRFISLLYFSCFSCCAEPGGGNVRTFQNFHFYFFFGFGLYLVQEKRGKKNFSNRTTFPTFRLSDFPTFRLSDFQSKFVESITQKLSRFST